MTYVLVYLNLSIFSKDYTDVWQHVIFLASALFNISKNPVNIHIKLLVEGKVYFKISLKVFSNTVRSYVANVGFQLRKAVVDLVYLIFQVRYTQVLYIHSC